ncbi:anthranilate synthase component I [Streptosporangium roseum]|uniref:Anthranilate synthase n=1 Tax=Streptosporangium roseum (strain ATCC 12428 / DSM 43021 / JCM 3005 / KCTC 9067 / NCIMB 10171 / NRRL 2505 / NI 9100) TaxID=479432 RepID=D2AV30_STRRD|nr:anthranilate synthase component I [Streptosporangium roseum]ACZ86892.1 anthranilate synthase [Streptosporangium roseum DSM 43021]
METSGYTTAGGIEVEVTASDVPETVLEDVVTTLGERRGGVLSSGMEYPGRYSRWHLAYVDPCLEIVARGRRISARALNARGRVVLPAVASCLLATGKPTGEPTAEHVEVYVAESEDILPEEMRSRRPTVFTAIREVIAAFKGENEHLGLYGSFGYDLAFQFEPIRQVLTRADDQRDLVLHLPDRVMVIDRKRETSKEYLYEFTVDGVSTRGLAREGESIPLPPAPAELPADPEKGTYAQVVAAAKEKFVRGDLFEVVPGQVFHAACTDPAAFYRGLRKANPAPFEFLFNLGEGEHLVGASPEMYVRVSGDRVETCPISGTIARGGNPIEDAEAIRTLLSSVKEESELTMCTDVDRNDKSRICVPGTVQVIGRRQIEMYSRLIHTVDHIEGRLRPEFDALDAFLTHMWAVTVTGAPKSWAMQFIEDHEATTRRWYGGAVGYIGFDGSMNTGLTLRTAQIRGGVATVRAGATLLFDSDPEAEERETELKASALLGALAAVGAARTPQERDVPQPVREQPGEGMKVLLVDHEDSFVNTLADYFRQQGAEVVTLRHGFPVSMIDEIAPSLVVLSPGPGWPSDFGLPELVGALYERDLPVFGVCLGLQGMVEQAGGTLELLSHPEHGKRGQVRRTGPGALLEGLPEEFTAARYHSLHAKQPGVVGFTATALTPDGAVMAIEDVARRRFAVQFHPESILTAEGGAGAKIISNVLRLCRTSG